MTTLSTEPLVRAHPIARLWTWIVSFVLYVTAAPLALCGVSAVTSWEARAKRGQALLDNPPLLDIPLLQSNEAVMAAVAGWLAALGLHFYASRRRRMHIAHVVVPAAMLLLSMIASASLLAVSPTR